MKKSIYTSPTLDLIDMEIEQGIAVSLNGENGFNDIYLEEEDVEW